MTKEDVINWYSIGMSLVKVADDLDKVNTYKNWSTYFYTLFLFEGNDEYDSVSLDLLKQSIKQLKKCESSLYFYPNTKQLLNSFLSLSVIMFDTEKTKETAKNLLKEQNLLPNAVKVLKNKIKKETNDNKSFSFSKGWNRINDSVENIGDFIEEWSDTISLVISVIVTGVPAIAILVGIINVFIDEGVIWGIIAAIFGIGIGYYVVLFLLGISALISKFVLKALRWIFLNLYVLLIVIFVIILICIFV